MDSYFFDVSYHRDYSSPHTIKLKIEFNQTPTTAPNMNGFVFF